MAKMYKKLFIVALIVIIFLLTVKTILIKNKVLLDFNYMDNAFYDAQTYLSNLDVNDVYYCIYYPTWLLITSKEDLKENELGIDLSEINLSKIDFNKNYVIITLGAKLRALHPYNVKNVNLQNESFAVDVYVRSYGIDDNNIFIYRIDKYNITKNMLLPPSGVFCVL